jgi:predicted transcriptional regulator of viral defense system
MEDSIALRHLPRGRARLASVLRASGDVIHIEDAARTLDLPRTQTAKLLSRWVKQGWLRRVGSGAYAPVPLNSLLSEQVLEDPWVLVPALFSPAYVGGRTAAEHWDLTEQIFRDIVVITGRTVRARNQVRHGAQFTLKHTNADKIFGTKSVWRGRTKIAVSDVHRTIIDMLDDLAIGGGIQHVADCFKTYLQRSDRDNRTLIEYAVRLHNGAVFKRLGFLAERNDATDLVIACKERLTKGTAKLDPALDSPRLVTHWQLWVPPNLAREGGHD